MGAEQSSSRTAGASSVVGTRKTCYYEVLGVEQSAGDDDIRKAYKRKALELHPDRNLNDTENATRKFAEVQTAYEILSDPQERAWYDSHREAILTGDTDVADGATSEHYNVRLTSTEEVFNLMGRFSSTIPMDDSPNGFFGSLNAFFDQLAMEEAAACEWDARPPPDFPPFGLAGDAYEDTPRRFYGVWSGFSTSKSFSWKDKYRLSDAPDRRVRRLMEKENKKFREEGVRDFNDAVRSLVAFVKKRDPRYVPNTQSEADRQKVLRESAAAQAARSRAENQRKVADYVVPEWARSRQEGDNGAHDEFLSSEEESEVEHIECVVCDKIFKSEKAFEAHERSKKHVKAVQQLSWQMKNENAAFDLGGTPKADESDLQDANDASDVDADEGGLPHRSTVSEPRVASTEHSDDAMNAGAQPTSEDVTEADDPLTSSEDDEYAPRAAVEGRLFGSLRPEEGNVEAENGLAGLPADKMTNLNLGETSQEKLGKAKAKRQKKAAKQAAMAEVGEGDEGVEANKCTVCHEMFPSRTKLFSHIKAQNHAVPLGGGNVPQAKKHGKKQKR